jgi:hypothetical protein
VDLRITQVALLVAAAGAIVILVGLLGTVASLVGLGAIALGTLLTAPAGRGRGGGWWTLLATGAVLSGLGALLSLASDGVGGLVALLGGIAVVAGAAMGFPLE